MWEPSSLPQLSFQKGDFASTFGRCDSAVGFQINTVSFVGDRSGGGTVGKRVLPKRWWFRLKLLTGAQNT